MSPRAVPRRAHVCGLLPRKGEAHAEANRHIWMVGKQSTIGNRDTSRSISFLAELSSSFGIFHRLSLLAGPPQQDVHLGRLPCAGQIRSAELPLLRSNCKTVVVRPARNPFSCNEFLLGVCGTALTKGSSERNMPPHRGRSRCVASAEMAAGWVPAPLTKSGED